MNWNASALCAPAAAHPLVHRLSNVNVSYIQNWTKFKKIMIILICLKIFQNVVFCLFYGRPLLANQ